MLKLQRIVLGVVLGVALLVQGCATTTSPAIQTEIPIGSGRIVVYRIQNYIAMFAGPSVFINGNELGKVYPGKYFEVPVAPGMYQIKFEGNFLNFPGPTHTMSVSVEPDRTIYIELSTPGGGGPAVVTRHYYLRTAQEAEPALSKLSKHESR